MSFEPSIVSFLLVSILLVSTFVLIAMAVGQHDGLLLMAFLFAYMARVGVSFYNAYIGPSIGADEDALMFIQNASPEYPLWLAGTEFYLGVLGRVFLLFERSSLIAHILGSVTSLLFLLVYIKSLKKLGGQKHILLLAFVLVALSPAQVLFTSISLRESYQLLFSGLVVLFSINISIEKGRNAVLNWVGLFSSCLILAMLHKGLIVISLLYFWIALMIGNARRFWLFSLLMFCALFVLQVSFQQLNSRAYEVFFALLSGDILSYIENYRASGSDLVARANYDAGNILEGNLILSLIQYLAYYQFYPFVWNARSILDVYASLEGVVRFILMGYVFINFRQLRMGELRNVGLLLVLFYIVSSAIWAVGTSNYGTGMRHHVTHDFILILCSYFIYSNLRKEPYQNDLDIR